MRNMNVNVTIDIRTLPIIVVDVDEYYGAVSLKIGNGFASVTELKLAS
jgi:hypothetical protein